VRQFATAPELRNDSLHHYSTISMSLSQTEILRRLRFPGYLVLALLAGLPAISTGSAPCGGDHSLGEWCQIEPIYRGIKKLILLEAALSEK